MRLRQIFQGWPTDFGFRLQVVITVLVVAAVVWVGIQTGDWTGLVLVIPLAVLIPIVAKLPAERPVRRRPGNVVGTGAPGGPTTSDGSGATGGTEASARPGAKKDDRPRRY